jgi:branched-chain amino acid transport system ATP-binding protein
VPDLLVAEGLCAGYGDSTVLEGVSFALEQGGSLALIGRNGVGKTTLLTASEHLLADAAMLDRLVALA